MLTKKEYKITRIKLTAELAVIERVSEPSTTIYLPAKTPLVEVETLLRQMPSIEPNVPGITNFVAGTETGAVIFWGQNYKLVIKPPFPVKEKYITAGYDTEILSDILNQPAKIGIILVRLGFYALGIAENERLIAHKTGTGLVHGRQRQGGSSANRFRQRRVEQTHHFLERVVVHAKEMFESQARTLDYFVYGGARTTITELMKHSIFFKQFKNRLLPPLLDIPNPHFEVMEQAVTDIWSSRVMEWNEIL
jgi:peptide subunit release factor 1 (eRF1)